MTDTYYNNTVLMLPMEPASAPNRLVEDYSAYHRSMTNVGNAVLSNAAKYGSSALILDGNASYISVGDSPELNLGSRDFTIEVWLKILGWPVLNNGTYTSAIVCKDTQTSRALLFVLSGASNSLTSLTFAGFDTNTTYTAVSGAYNFSLDTWYHVSVSRVGNLVYLFVNGNLLNVGGTAFSRAIQTTPDPLLVGGNTYNATYFYYLNGIIDNLRIINGTGIYTTNFTPPGDLTGGYPMPQFCGHRVPNHAYKSTFEWSTMAKKGSVLPNSKKGDMLYQHANWGGTGTITGLSKIGSVAVQRKVRLYDAVNGVLIREQWSGLDGTYVFPGLSKTVKFTVTATDYSNSYNDVTAANVTAI